MKEGILENSPIILGCDGKAFRKGLGVEPVLDEAYSSGLRVFDTARGYGKSEEQIGRWMEERNNREEIFLISKGCLPYPFPRVNPKCLEKDLATSLRKLRTSYIDLYLLHRDQRKANMEAIFDQLEGYRKEGKIRQYGVSNWTASRVKEVNDMLHRKGYPPIRYVSDNLTLLPWVRDPFGGGDGCVSLTGDEESLGEFKKMGVGILSYSPLARGMLSGRVDPDDEFTLSKLSRHTKKGYISEKNLAKLRYLLRICEKYEVSLPTLSISYLCHMAIDNKPVLGINNPSRIKENLAAAKLVLPKEAMEEIASIVNR